MQQNQCNQNSVIYCFDELWFDSIYLMLWISDKMKCEAFCFTLLLNYIRFHSKNIFILSIFINLYSHKIRIFTKWNDSYSLESCTGSLLSQCNYFFLAMGFFSYFLKPVRLNLFSIEGVRIIYVFNFCINMYFQLKYQLYPIVCYKNYFFNVEMDGCAFSLKKMVVRLWLPVC